MKDEFTQQKLRAAQYQHIDGSFELTFGLSLLLMAIGYFVINRLLLTNPRLSDLLGWIPLIIFVLGVILIDRLVKRFRRRTTYPRTGFISPSRPAELTRPTRLIIWIGVPLFSVLMLVFLLLNRSRFASQSQNNLVELMTVFFGLLMGGLWILIGWKIALPRFYLIALVSLAVSVVLFLRGVGGWLGFAWLLGSMGLSLFISGFVTLRKYLRRNPAPDEGPDGS